MNRVVYMSDRLAVFRPGRETSSVGQAVDSLLKLNPDKTGKNGFEQQLKNLVTNFGSRFGALPAYIGCPLYGTPIEDVEPEELKLLGLETTSNDYGDAIIQAPFSDGNVSPLMLLDLALVASMAGGLQYLARLYFCAIGDERAGDMVFDAALTLGQSRDADFISARTALPHVLLRKMPGMSDRDEILYLLESKTIMPFQFTCLDEGMKAPANDKDIKKAAASYQFSQIVNNPQVRRFRVNARTFEPEQFCGASPTDELVLELAELAANTLNEDSYPRLMLCPNENCNRPIAVLSKGKKHFCDGSCQQRYKEQAQKYLKSGASVQDVKDRYKFIKGGSTTIQAWER